MEPAAAFDVVAFIGVQALAITAIVVAAITAGLGIWVITYGVKVGIAKFAGFARKG